MEFMNRVHNKYDDTRNNFGDLFDYTRVPSSSFMGAYLSAGAVTIRQLYHSTTNKTYKEELLWN